MAIKKVSEGAYTKWLPRIRIEATELSRIISDLVDGRKLAVETDDYEIDDVRDIELDPTCLAGNCRVRLDDVSIDIHKYGVNFYARSDATHEEKAIIDRAFDRLKGKITILSRFFYWHHSAYILPIACFAASLILLRFVFHFDMNALNISFMTVSLTFLTMIVMTLVHMNGKHKSVYVKRDDGFFYKHKAETVACVIGAISIATTVLVAVYSQ